MKFKFKLRKKQTAESKISENSPEQAARQDLTLALLVANAAAVFALYALVKISKRKHFPTLEAIRKVYSGIMYPEDYQD